MKFKNDSGVWYTRALFIETAPDKSTAIYTLKDEDLPGYPSLYRLFMEVGDPEEYTFAITHLGGWQHWKTLRESAFFKATYLEWKEELETKYRSQAVAGIIKAAQGTSRDALQAAKYVAEKGWDKKPSKATRGRPSKEQVAKAAHEIALNTDRINEDFDRIMGNA